MSLKRNLSVAMAALALAACSLAAAGPADAATYRTGGAIGARYLTTAGTLGAPISSEYSGRTGRVQNFRYGSVYWSAATGAHSVRGGILAEYRTQGSEAGGLGLPLTEEIKLASGVYQQFKGGFIYWTGGHGAHAVLGGIRSRYAQLGAEKGVLGYPTSGEITVKVPYAANPSISAAVVTQTFEHGILTWSSAPDIRNDHRAHEVTGELYKKYQSFGGVNVHGFALFPAIPVQSGAGSSGPDDALFQAFQNTWMTWSAATGAHVITFPFQCQDCRNREGLGLPTTDPYQSATAGLVQDYEGGRVEVGPGGVKVILGTDLPPVDAPASPSPTATATDTATATASPTQSATADPTATATDTATATASPTQSATAGPTGTAAPTDSATPAP